MKKNLFVYPRLEKYRLDPLKCVFCFSFFYFIGLIYYIRAIRTRTVDLLGKTDQTYYYQNDLNCFKDPTCIFVHWALSLTAIYIGYFTIFFS